MPSRRIRIVLIIATPVLALVVLLLLALMFGTGSPGGGWITVPDRYAALAYADPSSAQRIAHAPAFGAAGASKDTITKEAVAEKGGLLAILGTGGEAGDPGGVGGLGVDRPASAFTGEAGGTSGMGGGHGHPNPLPPGGRGGPGKAGDPAVMGSMSKEMLGSVIRENSDQIRTCYERELKRHPALSGRLSVRFTIDSRGQVPEASVTGTTLDSPEVEQCITDRVRTWRFPAPKGGGAVLVTYPFVFRSAGGDADRSGGDEDAPRRFLAASGYFGNTYLPGDPQVAWLRKQLEQGILTEDDRRRLEKSSVPYLQPFDPPSTAGLAVYLSADRSHVEGPTRMIVQVGLKGSERHARRRASLEAVLVVDLREVPAEDIRRILWTLADSMAGDLQSGDRFSLVVAGVKNPLRLGPERFDPAGVRRELARALQEVEGHDPAGTLGEALDEAFGALAEGAGDRSTPLGTRLVLLASATDLSAETGEIEARVHAAAIDGVTFTMLGVGPRADPEALGVLALAGQGRRRLLTDFKRARRIMEEELSASGRVVARAVRLRIRLAENVRLVEVLGSAPLGEEQSTRVREAEQAVDFRVAETLGIEADRGEDEEGIQIVIPAYYAGDDHAVLLDVLAPGPGKVADVQVRYKDLVNLRNTVARAGLSLPAGRAPESPLTLNVRKNTLAMRISMDLRRAAQMMSSGDVGATDRALQRAVQRVDAFRGRHPSLQDDAEIERDVAMLAEYRRVLAGRPGPEGDAALRTHLSHSLAYAGFAKLPPGHGERDSR